MDEGVHVVGAYLGVSACIYSFTVWWLYEAVSGYVAEYGDTCVGVCLSVCLSLCICEPQLRASDVGKIPQTARVSLRMSFY